MGTKARLFKAGLLASLLVLVQAAAPAYAHHDDDTIPGNPPYDECDQPQDEALFNKFQFSDGFSFSQGSTDPEQIVTLTENEDGSWTYTVTSDDYVLVRIVWKIGEGGDASPPDPMIGSAEDPLASTGDLAVPAKLSHVTFCFAAAGDDTPEQPVVSATIVCDTDADGNAVYTLDVNAPAGVTTNPADGATVDNEDTEVVVTWEGGTFSVTAQETEDCSEDDTVAPQAAARIVCVADDETGIATYRLDVDLPEGATSDPGDGATVENETTEVTVDFGGGDTRVLRASATRDCSFEVAGEVVEKKPRVLGETFENEELAATGLFGGSGTGTAGVGGVAGAGITLLAIGAFMVGASRRGRFVPLVEFCDTSIIVIAQARARART